MIDRLFNIQDDIQSTNAALARLEMALIENREVDSLKLTLSSLIQRREVLEQEFLRELERLYETIGLSGDALR